MKKQGNMSQKRRLDDADDINLSLDEIARKNRISLNNASGTREDYHKRNNNTSYQKRKRSKWDRLKDNDDDDDDDSGDDDLDIPRRKYSSSDEDNEPIDIKRNVHEELEEVILQTPKSQKIHGMNSHNTHNYEVSMDDTHSTPTLDFYECSNEGNTSEYEEQQQQQQQNHYQFLPHAHQYSNVVDEDTITIPRNKYLAQKNLHNNNFPNNKYQKFNNYNLNRKQICRQPRQNYFTGKRPFNKNSQMNNNRNNNNNDGSSSDDDEPVDITKGIGGDFAVEETILNFNYKNCPAQPFSMVPIQTFPSSSASSSASPSSSTSSLSYNYNFDQSPGNSNGCSSASSLDSIGLMNNKKMNFQNENIFLSRNISSPQHEVNSVAQNSVVENKSVARNPFFANLVPPPKANMPTPLKKMPQKLPTATATNERLPVIRNPFLVTSQEQTVAQNPFFATKSPKTENNPFFATRNVESQSQQQQQQKQVQNPFFATRNVESQSQQQQQQKQVQNPFFMTPKKQPILSSSVSTDKKENQVVIEKNENPFFFEKITKRACNLSNSDNDNNIHNQKSFVGVATPKKGNTTYKKLITFDNDDTEPEKEVKMAVIDSDSEDSSSVSKNSTDSRNVTLDSSGLDFSGILSSPGSSNLSLEEIIAKKTGKTLSRRGSFNSSKAIEQGCPPELTRDPKMMKYWYQRHKLFSKYDDGIKLDYESWYSVTPEEIASCIAERCSNPDAILIDAFCGCGGNTIQFATRVKKVIAIDIDPIKIEYAKHNARIYGVYDKIEFVVGNFMELAPILKADMVFLSPPWGGVEYLKSLIFDLRTMIPLDGFKVFERANMITPNVAYFVPRTTSSEQLLELAGNGGVDIEQNKLGNRVLTITAYYGQLAKKSEKVNTT